MTDFVSVTYFGGNERNVENGEIISGTFKELAELYCKPQKGGKHEGYFVRGELKPLYRKDANLESSKLLIIDGDASIYNPNSAPNPKLVHDYLVRKNITHFLYTSHSHSKVKNKYRVVILCDLPSRDYLKPTAHKIVEDLNNAKIPIKYVKEMGTWSQPWFIPRRDDPTDGLFEYYYYEGIGYKSTTISTEKELLTSGDSQPTEHVTTVERIRQIQAGEVLHDNLIALSWGFLQDGMHPTVIQATLEGIMAACEIKDERWESRLKDIPRYISDAVPKQELETVDLSNISTTSDTFIEKIPWPPGLLGKLADSAYDMQLYQHKEVALVSAVGLIAGIAGRKYNISNTGLNVYLTLIMGTGMGKDSISEFIEYCLTNLDYDLAAAQGNPLSFLGAGRFTGPKSVLLDLKDARSQVCVFTEAGLLLQSDAGDTNGLTRCLLSLYTCSGAGRMSKREEFSDKAQSVPSIFSPALTIINEATPETLLNAFVERKSAESGELPRQSIFRIHVKKPYMNRMQKRHLNGDCKAKLKYLISLCKAIQSDDRPKVENLVFDDGIDSFGYADYWVEEENKNKGTNDIKAIMASRMHVKAMKFAAIATVFNRKDTIIREEEWNWAKSVVEFEYNGINSFFQGSAMDNEIDNLTRNVVGITVVKILKNEYKSKKEQMDKKYRKKGIFAHSSLSQILKNNKRLTAFNSSKYSPHIRSGLDKVLDYMVRQGFLNKLDEDPMGGKYRNLYMITDTFSWLMEQGD